MNRIAKIWEELDKKNGRHANLSKAGKRKNVKLAKVSDFEEFEKEDERLVDDLRKLEIIIEDDLDLLFSTMLSDAETLLSLNEEFEANVKSTYEDLEAQFDELGMEISTLPVFKLYQDRMFSATYNRETVKEIVYKGLEKFENQVRSIIGSK
tara:strand:+ start:1721 stop:2176 length:456 start_codon:yes stop_codon:yes gene_type:complete